MHVAAASRSTGHKGRLKRYRRTMSQAPQTRRQPRRVLPIVNEAQDIVDGRSLQHAQRLIDDALLDAALAVLAPRSAEPSTSLRAQASLLAAALLSRRGQPALVLELLERIPDGVVVDRGFFLLLRAQAARQLRHVDLALRDAHEACAIAETSGRLLVLADCLKANDDIDAAVVVLQRARVLDPGSATVLGQLCGLLALAGDDAGSDEAWCAFAALSPAKADAADRHRSAAFALVCRQEFQDAVDAAALAVQLEPSITRAWLDDDDDMGPIRRDPRLR